VTSLQPIHYTAVVYFLAAVVLNVIYDFNSGLTLVLRYDCGRPMVMIMIMATLWNRAGHYIFALWFLSFFLLSSFFPRLISAVGDWMSTILWHMVWP